MHSMGVQAVLSIVLLFIATGKADDPKGNIAIWQKTVTLTCPENGVFFNSSGELHTGQSYEFEYIRKARYRCEYTSEGKTTKYYFYVEGNVCDNCFELDGELFLLVIVADILGTAVLIIIIYRCTKKKNLAGPPQPSKPPARPGGRAPNVPSRDYETLNPQTRAQDTYSTVVNRMG